jgi:hypothetical protein
MRSCDISYDEVPVDTDEGFGIHQLQEAQPRVEGQFLTVTLSVGATHPDPVPEED